MKIFGIRSSSSVSRAPDGSRVREGRPATRIAGMMLAVLVSLLPAITAAQAIGRAAPPQFTDRAEARRFHALTGELRCVKCQNQSLADSDAAIAQDLRHEVLELMRQGRSDEEIKRYLVARYGEFVLYRPRVEPGTWLLWFGPALVLLAGAIVVVLVVRRRSQGRTPPPVDDGQEW